jgi:hypothetical protein
MRTTNKKEKLVLDSGSLSSTFTNGGSLLLVPEMSKFSVLCDSIQGTLANAGVTSEDVLKTLRRTRLEVFAELYPKLPKMKRK